MAKEFTHRDEQSAFCGNVNAPSASSTVGIASTIAYPTNISAGARAAIVSARPPPPRAMPMPEEGASPSEVHSEKRREESGEAEDIGGVVEAVRATVPAPPTPAPNPNGCAPYAPIAAAPAPPPPPPPTSTGEERCGEEEPPLTSPPSSAGSSGGGDLLLHVFILV